MSKHLLLNRAGTRFHPFTLPSRTIIPHLRLSPIALPPPRLSPLGIRSASTASVYRPPSGFLFNERVPHPFSYEQADPGLASSEGETTAARGLGGVLVDLWDYHGVVVLWGHVPSNRGVRPVVLGGS
jgi:hypothetical protein